MAVATTMNVRSYLLSSLTVFTLFTTWYLLSATGIANDLFLPGPEAVWKAFVKVATRGY